MYVPFLTLFGFATRFWLLMTTAAMEPRRLCLRFRKRTREFACWCVRGKGVMGGGMGMGQGMMDGCPMMMDVDPKTRGEMMQIQGRMMKEMGELMERRGKEIEQGK